MDPKNSASTHCSFSHEASEKTVVMAADYQLQRTSHFQRLAIATVALGVSRREIPNILADAIYGFEGTIYFADGRKFEPTDTEIDDTFADPDFRWISDFLSFAETEPRQRPQRRVIARLRLIVNRHPTLTPDRRRMLTPAEAYCFRL